MSNDLSIADLIANGTLSADQAATLWAMVEEQHSFVVVAIPRLAGKSTTMDAILGLLSPTVPVHRLSGDEAEMARLKAEAKGGYLIASEISPGPVHDYLWGAPVLRLFDTLTFGSSLPTAMAARTFASDMAMQVTDDMVQVFGGYGISKENTVEKFYRDAKLLQIMDGTNEVVSLRAAEEL